MVWGQVEDAIKSGKLSRESSKAGKTKGPFFQKKWKKDGEV